MCHSLLYIIILCRLPLIAKEKLTKWRKTLFLSVYAVPIFVYQIFVYQKQTYHDKYVDFSHLFQKIHKFSCVLVYIWICKNQTVCSQATINFVYFFQIFVSKGNKALDKKCILLLEFQPACKTNVHPRRLVSVLVYCTSF